MSKLFAFQQAVLWVDGDNLLGQINEIELPELEWKRVDHETIGLIGTPKFPRSLEPMEITIKPMQFSPALARMSANPFRSYSFQLRANIGEYTSDNKTGDRSLKIDWRGKFPMRSGGTFGSEEMETEYQVDATYYREIYDGETFLEIDVNVPMYFAGGVDIMALARTNVGL